MYKLIIVGPSNVGKTCIINRLIKDVYQDARFSVGKSIVLKLKQYVWYRINISSFITHNKNIYLVFN